MRAETVAADDGLTLAGEELRLLPERALFWTRTATLIIADPHLGKAAALRAASIAVPEGTADDDLERLSRAITRCAARRLVILGDLLHARNGCTAATLAAVTGWRQRHPDLELVLVRGNHDAHAGDPPDAWRITCVNDPWHALPFVMRHVPGTSAEGYVLAGHLHPAVRLSGAGRQRVTLPCFWFGPRAGVLPAFGGFTGTAIITPAPGDQVFVITGDEVITVPVTRPTSGA